MHYTASTAHSGCNDTQIITSVFRWAKTHSTITVHMYRTIQPGSHAHAHIVQTLVIARKHSHLSFPGCVNTAQSGLPGIFAHISQKLKAHLASQVCTQAWRRCGRGRCAGLSSGRSPRPSPGSRTAAGGRSSASPCCGCYLAWGERREYLDVKVRNHWDKYIRVHGHR